MNRPNPSEPAIRVIDLAEYALVVSVDRYGAVQMSSATPCPSERARMLRDLADRVERTAHACCGVHPAVPAAPPAAAPAVNEQQAGHPSFDDAAAAAAPIWTDDAGSAWNLAVGWCDVGGVEWTWAGRYDRSGVPLMRTPGSTELQPLDVLAAAWGPLSPVRGQR